MVQGDRQVCAIDTETHLIEPGLLAPRLVCLSYCDGQNVGLVHREELGSKMLELLDKKGLHIVGHNIAFDMAVLAADNPSLLPAIFQAYNEGRIHDTCIREQLIDIAAGNFRGAYRDENQKSRKREYSLAGIAHRRLKVFMEKDNWRLRYAELSDTPIKSWPEGAKEYARKDAQVTFAVYEHQKESEAVLSDAAAQARAAFALHLMSCWGVITDVDKVRELEERLDTTLAEQKELLRSFNLLRRNGTKDMKAIRSLVESCLDNPPRTATGSVKTDEQTLARCDHPGLVALTEYKGADKLRGTWLKHLKAGCSKPIQPNYNVLVETGRTSCSGPNLQNPHRGLGLRECFVPREGYLYAACDYSSLEMCTLAQVCIWLFGSSALAVAINKGIDPHLKLAAQILAIDYDTAFGRISSGDKEVREVRQISKAANFGYPGGMGAEKFRQFASGYGVTLSQQQASDLRENWFNAWPEMRRYFNHISSITNHPNGQLKQFHSNRLRGGLRFTSACNSYFQGLAADGAKAALYHVVRKCYTDIQSALFGSRPVMFIHDEIILEAPVACASAAADELSETMKQAMQVVCPDVKIRTSVALMPRWYKDADEVRNDKGELLIWEKDNE